MAFAIGLILSVGLLMIETQKALAAPVLKPISVVGSDTLMLGDLFDGLEQNDSYVLGPAPQPGQDMVLNARTLYRIAVAMDLDWRPQTSAEQVVVRRAATVIPPADIDHSLREALKGEGLTGNFNVLTSGAKDIVLPPDMPQTVEVSKLRFDPTKDYFEAVLVAPSAEKPVKKVSVMGQVERLEKIPVLKHPLRNGDVIGQTDIDYIELPARQIQHDTLLSEEDMVGMTPRRMTLAGKPVMNSELERPTVVERGDIVTIVFNDGKLALTTRGKAMQDGATGDLIRITNLNSNKGVDAMVTGYREVTVR